MNIIKQLRSLDRNWKRMEPAKVADRLVELMNQAKTFQEQKAVADRIIRFTFPILDDFATAKRRMMDVASRILNQNSLEPLKELGSLAGRITGRDI